MKKARVGKWLWGLVLVTLGVILGLRALGLAEIDIFFPGWWTLFIIVPCAIGVICDRGERVGNLIGLMIGVGLLLGCLGVVKFSMIWRLVLPATLVIVGVAIIFGDLLKKQIRKEMKGLHTPEDKVYQAVFGEQKLNFDNEDFEGAKLETVFGGIKCDLREAKMKQDVMISANSVFGGVTIYPPEKVNVEVVSTSVFGGVTDHRRKAKGEKKQYKHTLYVNATCLFGGVDIR